MIANEPRELAGVDIGNAQPRWRKTAVEQAGDETARHIAAADKAD